MGDEFSAFCDQHPERKVVVYANTSAAVKARADWVVTSSIALDVVAHLKSQGEKIIWAPDKHLGNYIERETGADMLMWDSACIVHDEFKAKALEDLKKVHPTRNLTKGERTKIHQEHGKTQNTKQKNSKRKK